MSAGDAITSRTFRAATAASLMGVAGLCLFVASSEWFSRDDFAFLALARAPDWSWLDTYLPLAERPWPFYRPFGVQTFFRLGIALFGLEPFGFFVVIVAVHLATGVWVWRLATQLGFGAPFALVAATLSISRFPSLTEIFYGAMFQYVALCFFTVASLSLFLDYARQDGARRQVGSCLALVLALLCNEAAAGIVAILVLVPVAVDGRSGRSVVRATRSALPQIGITLGYLVLTFGVLAQPRMGTHYRPSLATYVPGNLWLLVQQVFGDDGFLTIAGLLLAVALTAALATAAHRTQAGAWLLRVSAACIGWTVVALAPYALLPFPQPRWSVVAEAPLSLLIAAGGCAVWRLASTRWRPAIEFGMLGLALATVPYGELLARAASPIGEYPQRFVAFLESEDLPETGGRVVLLYGSEGLATQSEAELARGLVFTGAIFRALYPDADLTLRVHDLNEPPKRAVLVPGCVYALLRSDLTLERADDAFVERTLGPWMQTPERRGGRTR